MHTLVARSATAGAAETVASTGTRFTALDLKVNFLRPWKPRAPNYWQKAKSFVMAAGS
jgi:hypothetical protein